MSEEDSIYDEIELLRYKVENLMNENLEQQKQIICLTNQLEEKKRLLDIVCSSNTNIKPRKRNEENKKKLSFYHANKNNINIDNIQLMPHWQQIKKLTDKMYESSLKNV